MDQIRRNVMRVLAITVAAVALGGCSSDRIVAPEPTTFFARLNGFPVKYPGEITVDNYYGGGDTLRVHGGDLDLRLSIWVPYTGAGTYVLNSTNVGVTVLEGGDVRTGTYVIAAATGTLVLSAPDESGMVTAEFSFDAAHASGVSRYGPTLQVREGFVRMRPIYLD